MGLFRRLPIHAGIEVLLPATVVLFALGSTSVPSLVAAGHRARWAALIALAACAAAAARGRLPRAVPASWAAGAALVGLGAVSAAWSVDVHITIARLFTLAVLFSAAAALALAWPTAVESARRVQRGLVRGIALVALASLVLVAVHRSDAVLGATTGSGWRFQGLEENPDTLGMLLAVGLPLAVATAARNLRTGIALLLLFAGELASSGSRGGLLAGIAGAIVAAVAVARTPRVRVLSVAALLVLAAICAVTPKLQGTVQSVNAPPQSERAGAPVTRGTDAELVFRLQDELGHPPLGAYRPPVPRTFLGSSGRIEAWNGAFHQGTARPVDGYGFGTEDRVFVDRFYAFEGIFPESSYLGVFLQLGTVGIAVFAALLLLLLRDGWRARSLAPGAGAAGVLVAAILVGITQSGLLSVGNLAVTSIWISALSLPLLVREAVR